MTWNSGISQTATNRLWVKYCSYHYSYRAILDQNWSTPIIVCFLRCSTNQDEVLTSSHSTQTRCWLSMSFVRAYFWPKYYAESQMLRFPYCLKRRYWPNLTSNMILNIGRLIDWYTSTLLYQYVGIPVHCYTSTVLVYQYIIISVHWHVGILAHWWSFKSCQCVTVPNASFAVQCIQSGTSIIFLKLCYWHSWGVSGST